LEEFWQLSDLFEILRAQDLFNKYIKEFKYFLGHVGFHGLALVKVERGDVFYLHLYLLAVG
jgi:hypothetical protein